MIPVSFQIRDLVNLAFPIHGIYQIAITLVAVPIIVIMLYKTITRYSHYVSDKTFSIIVVVIFVGMIVSSLLFGFFGNESLQPKSISRIK
ncbi:hypothetical protein [Nitrosopumilus sp.]|uniref:hypothetical protein n=1 Tax=Nitrosopumilus sp. TaxID=2024843 RepID=UPI003B5B35DF